ncbi:MAG: helix-turn-helix transcriptional regulator [Lachnospiraceae bacterium]|nr:helix-turn-helix transcriptional regulator [Lachnospiraceae bacterium]
MNNEFITLYPGIELCYLTFSSDSFSAQHKTMAHMIQINYCKAGQLIWEMENGNRIYLNPGDFSLHTIKVCADSVLTFPGNMYQGLTICIDLQEASGNPPELLKDNNIFETVFPEKFCRNDTPVFFAGNEQTESIFSAFYNQPEVLKLSYQKIKALELFLYLAKVESTPPSQLTAYQSEQVAVIRQIHDQLLLHMEQRITIEELSRQYLINPTTLKNAFKSVYGTSIAAHIKEHRMEQAAKMLKETDKTIAEIAQAVGYDSQSKFTAAFKAFFQVLPKDYRKSTSYLPS